MVVGEVASLVIHSLLHARRFLNPLLNPISAFVCCFLLSLPLPPSKQALTPFADAPEASVPTYLPHDFDDYAFPFESIGVVRASRQSAEGVVRS